MKIDTTLYLITLAILFWNLLLIAISFLIAGYLKMSGSFLENEKGSNFINAGRQLSELGLILKVIGWIQLVILTILTVYYIFWL